MILVFRGNFGTTWLHCEKHNIDYPARDECPLCAKEWEPDYSQLYHEDGKPIQIRLRNRETPKGQIECPIGGTVSPSFCKNKRCAYTEKCTSYKNYLAQKKPSKLEQILLELRYRYWQIRAKLYDFKMRARHILFLDIGDWHSEGKVQ